MATFSLPPPTRRVNGVLFVLCGTARGQSSGVAARVPDPDGGDGTACRLLRRRRILLSRAQFAGQRRAASRPVRPGVRALLQGRRDSGRPESRASRRLAEEARRAFFDSGGKEADRGARRLRKADGDIAPKGG